MRRMRLLSLRRVRRLAARVKARAAARVLLGLVAAFACGVALGVGVAAMLSPDTAETVARVAGAAGKGAGKNVDAAPYAVDVKVRQEGQAMHPPATVPEGQGMQDPVPATPPAAAAGSGVRLVTKPTLPPEESGPDLSGALSPPSVARNGTTGELETPAQSPIAKAPAATAPDGGATPPSVPEVVNIAPPQPEQTPAAAQAPAQGETVPPNEARGTVEEAPPAQAETDRSQQLALGPAGMNGAVSAGARGEAPAPGVPATLPAQPLQPTPKTLTLAAVPMPRDAAWIRNAVKLPAAPRDVSIAIIIDDMGIDQKRSKLIIGLPAPLTLSFIPYGYHLKELVAASRAAGHEIMLHLPMEPMDPDADPGPNALRTTVSLEENHRRIEWALTRFDGFVGLNNHMGSKFTAWKPGMELVMREVQARGLLFVDSFTNNESVGYALARQHKLPSASRDVFIDHDITRVAIDHSLKELERIARRRGYAVGIAHPHDLSREMLKTWINEAKSRGVDFVPISHIAQRAMKTG